MPKRRRHKHHISREAIKTLSLRDVVTILTIITMVIALAGGTGWAIKSPGTVKSEKLEIKTDSHIEADVRIHTEQDKRITTLETDFKKYLVQWKKDIKDIKTGQDRVAEALEKMAPNP